MDGRYRLATTLPDPTTDPADQLLRLYSERWEIESAYFALRHLLLAGRVLRSSDGYAIEQELWATLALYQALRAAMVDAVETVPGTDPDRAGFTVALETARTQVVLPSEPAVAPDRHHRPYRPGEPG
ncbi:hypothetical protein [Streptomyces turgidiscabies]|uniref:Transposase n=1 Tax=Streptomyces turgidiscabies TaxID=85558 RepID=A0ABU0RYZ5_9ACTN|nr:hypothetical protein [Streptomyces turgidiscabies]MDQ0936392.1 hypothetical protein [Streptomyces turgidiscabies]